MGPATPMEEILKVTSSVFYKGSRGERLLENEECKKKRYAQFLATQQGQRPIIPQKEKPKSAPLENAINAGSPDTRKDVP